MIECNCNSRYPNIHCSGYQIDCWNGQYLLDISNKVEHYLPHKNLRKYQEEAIFNISESLRLKKRSLLYMATGLGKTVVTGAIIRQLIEKK